MRGGVRLRIRPLCSAGVRRARHFCPVRRVRTPPSSFFAALCWMALCLSISSTPDPRESRLYGEWRERLFSGGGEGERGGVASSSDCGVASRPSFPVPPRIVARL